MRRKPGFRCLLAASLVFASGVPARPAGAHLPSLIAFDRAIDGSGRIHVVGPDGRGDRTITPESGFEAPVWSPDGSTLVYESGGGLANSELYSYAISTSTVRRLTRHRGLDAFPSWSPDGSRIAWTTQRGGAFEIWVMRRDGTGAHRLTSGRADSHPAWSPDGGAIAYVRAPTGSLEVVRADGTRHRVVGGGRAVDASAAPSWSPDGRWLAVAGVDGALAVVAVDGHATRRLTPHRPGTIAWRPSWSPRGGQIAFINLADGALDVVDVGPGRVHVLARHTDGLSTPSWSPDGRLLVFADRSEHLATVSSDGHARRVLTHGISSDANPAWRPANS
jgi:TolB protein